MFDLTPAANQVARLLDGIDDDQLADPTPCPEYSVAAMLDHLMGLCLAFTWGAAKQPPAELPPGVGPGLSTAEQLDPKWRELLPQRLAGLATAWQEPAAWEGLTEVGGVRLPAPAHAAFALDELVMHGWDLASGTGQRFTVDETSAAVVLELTMQSAQPEQAANRSGLFGPVVAVPADASDFERALGFAGRDPAWTPETSL